MNCIECNVEIISNKRWRKMAAEEKAAAPFACHRGRRLCIACYDRAHKGGYLLDYERVTADSDSVLEDAIILVDERGYIYRQLPDAFEMTREGFSRMVKRAVYAGDERAVRLYSLNPYAKASA